MVVLFLLFIPDIVVPTMKPQIGVISSLIRLMSTRTLTQSKTGYCAYLRETGSDLQR